MVNWKDIPWKKFHRHVYRLQKRIFKASQRGDVGTRRRLQKLLMKSFAAKCLAVRRVTQDNQGKSTAGARTGAVKRGKEYGFFRRQLHFEIPDKTGTRKRKGGTVTPFGFRVGDLVKAQKSKEIYIGYIGGFTKTDKSKNVSICDYTWKRIGQFTPSKVKLLRRNNGLCIA